jgi:hypothetical protein
MVKFMAGKRLWLAPATAGDEPAYLVIRRAWKNEP